MIFPLSTPQKRVSIFLNKDFGQTCEVTVTEGTTYKGLISECKDRLGIDFHKKCKMFDSKGTELSDDDIEYLNEDEPIFLSQGEHFEESSKLLLYTEIKKLGQGGFGTVSLYQHKMTGQLVAIKKISIKTLSSPEDIKRVYNEILALRELRHPNIVKFHQSLQLKSEICVVMEYCSGGELKGFIQKFGPMTEETLSRVALQIISAVRYIHNSGIVHRDLKLENILFTDDSYQSVKIVDFGISGMFNLGNGDSSDCGSLLYIPPEFYTEHKRKSDPAFDTWALGCIFYYLITGFHPFSGKTKKEVIKKITSCLYKPLPSSTPSKWKKIITGLLKPAASSRLSVLKVESILDSPSDFSSSSEAEDKSKNVGLLLPIQRQGKSASSLKIPKIVIHKPLSPRPGNLEEVKTKSRVLHKSVSCFKTEKKRVIFL